MEKMHARTERLLTPERMAALRTARVAVVGLGGVGSWCAEALARSGVGTLILMDDDCVAPSNLNRQAEALLSTLGRPKTEALAARLRDAAPDTELCLLSARYTPEGREALFSLGPDVVADCIDSVADKCDLIRTAMERGIALVSSMGTGGKLDAARLRVGDLAKTQTCPLARAVRRELRAAGITHLPVVWSDEEPLVREHPPGSVMWVTATAGLLLAQTIALQLPVYK